MTLPTPMLLAAADPSEDLTPPLGRVHPDIQAYLIVLGAIAFVSVCAALWIVYVHKPKRRHRPRHRSHEPERRPESADGPAAFGPTGTASGEGGRRRRRRRRHRPRNPTLAETGGLPPIRQDGPPAPPQSQTQPQ